VFRKYRWPLIGAAIVILLLIGLLVRWWLGPQLDAAIVLRRDFVQTLVASGHVESPHRVDVGAQIIGTVLSVPVAEGQVVKAGDTLVELESGELNAAGREADAALVQAQARLRQLREVQAPVAEQTLRQAEATRDQARSVMARTQQLFNRGFVARAALDESREAVARADAEVQLTRKQFETTGATGSDQALAVADVAGARASAAAADARTDHAVIRAPVAGTLIGRDVEVGDVVQPGKVLLTLSPRGRSQLVVEIDEKNLRLLAIGQKALASADAYPQQRFPATLVYINSGVNALTGAVQVKLDVPSPPAILRQDMTVSVDIEVARRPHALLLPLGTVHDVDGTAPWVQRVEHHRAVRRPVRIGLRSGGYAEVIEGLDEGDLLIPADAGLASGARVRAVPPAAS
jgi:HlyD family secretion protein